MNGKKSYAVPILLAIVTGMAILAVLLYSKLLIAQQNLTTEDGKRLAERYTYALLFSQSLHDGADLLLKDESAAGRLRAKFLLGQATMASGETIGLFMHASSRANGLPTGEAFKPISNAMNDIISEQSGRIYTVAEHEGPLTPAEKDVLLVVRDGAARMKEQLLAFRPPTGDAGFRQMEAGGAWVDAANAAAKTLEETASKLKQAAH